MDFCMFTGLGHRRSRLFFRLPPLRSPSIVRGQQHRKDQHGEIHRHRRAALDGWHTPVLAMPPCRGKTKPFGQWGQSFFRRLKSLTWHFHLEKTIQNIIEYYRIYRDAPPKKKTTNWKTYFLCKIRENVSVQWVLPWPSWRPPQAAS